MFDTSTLSYVNSDLISELYFPSAWNLLTPLLCNGNTLAYLESLPTDSDSFCYVIDKETVKAFLRCMAVHGPTVVGGGY